MITVVVIGTCDTKLEELLYLRNQVLQGGQTQVILIDAGKRDVSHEAITITPTELSAKHGNEKNPELSARSEAIKFMARCASKAVADLYRTDSIHGIISAGGSGGTVLASEVMREALPIGFPKMIVSTVASGDTGPIVGETDIAMMYSVVDIAGLNRVLRDVLSNAGAAIAAAAQTYAERQKQATSPAPPTKLRIGITMFGVTTPGVDSIRRHLETNYPVEVFVFHATGHGGKAMERLVKEGALDAVLDLTTTEICDFVTGGVMSAGPYRLEAAAEAGIPYVLSLGATDMTNFGPRSTVPERYKDRVLYEHNSMVTLMRSSEEDARQIGEYICGKLKKHAKRPDMVQVWIPRGGVSMLSTPGSPFADSDADNVLFETVRVGCEATGIEVVDDERHINDAGFARDIAEALVQQMGFV